MTIVPYRLCLEWSGDLREVEVQYEALVLAAPDRKVAGRSEKWAVKVFRFVFERYNNPSLLVVL